MSVVIVGIIRQKPVLTHASIVCEGMLASVNSVNSYFHTWCGRSANLECRSEMCCTWLARNAGPKKSPKNRRHCPDSGRLYINTDPVIQVVRGALEVFSDDVLVEATQGGDLFGMRLCHVPEDRGCLPSIRDE